MGDWVVSDIALVQSDGLAIERVGQGFIRCCRIALAAGCKSNTANEVLIQLAF